MSEKTKIEWCDSTLNFWSGCTKVSPGCANCYAETLSDRKLTDAKGNLTIGQWGKGAPRKLHESAFTAALKLNRKPWMCGTAGCEMNDGSGFIGRNDGKDTPENNLCGDCLKPMHRRRIFSLSLADWLDPEVPAEWLARMLDTIRQCDQVTWILCTKRPELFGIRLREVSRLGTFWQPIGNWCGAWQSGVAVPPNVILLASVENQAMADKRIPELLKIPAACRGLSLEPLLGEVTISPGSDAWEKLNWLIIGGESGPDARPCNVDWVRSLVAQGRAAGVATFVKQLGADPVYITDTFHIQGSWMRDGDPIAPGVCFAIKDKKGGDSNEWPAHIRVREWPKL